jgi:1-acyl-sn-glycerol-3-phosphate acyltransferase
MNKILKIIFFIFIVKPLVLIGLGLNVVNRNNLPQKGPAILAANHNSHLDTILLMSLFPLHLLPKIRPVAAADYFLSNPLLAWFSLSILGIIPIERKVNKENKNDFLKSCKDALNNNDILIIFPEGSRGKPEEMSSIKKGIYRLVSDKKSKSVIPIMMKGLGAALPKGEALFVPFNCDVVIGNPIDNFTDSRDFTDRMKNEYAELSKLCITQPFYKDID